MVVHSRSLLYPHHNMSEVYSCNFSRSDSKCQWRDVLSFKKHGVHCREFQLRGRKRRDKQIEFARSNLLKHDYMHGYGIAIMSTKSLSTNNVEVISASPVLYRGGQSHLVTRHCVLLYHHPLSPSRLCRPATSRATCAQKRRWR